MPVKFVQSMVMHCPCSDQTYQELLPSLSALVMDSFASHVIRALLALLQPHLLSTSDHSGQQGKPSFSVRSKKSASFKAKQGPMVSVFSNEEENQNTTSFEAPNDFAQAAKNFVLAIREQLDETEIRALAANKVASPVLQVRIAILYKEEVMQINTLFRCFLR